MSVWKKIPIPPAGVMPGGLVTKIGIAATSLLLAAMLLTYTFTGGGAQDAEIEVPEAADLGLQQRAQAAIEAEARRQAAQLRLQADAAERQLAQLQGEQESNAALLSAGIVPLQGQDPEAGACFPTISLSPSAARPRAPRPRRCCWKHCGSRKWSAAGAPCAPGRLCCPTGTPKRGRTLPQRRGRKCRTHFRGWHRPPRALPRPPFPVSQPKTPLRRPETFSNCSPNSTIGNGPLPAQPALAAGGPAPAGVAPALALVQPETETPVAGLPSDPAGWDRIYEGSFLEAVLVTQLSGDFPGPVLANVSVPFYSADRQRVLIPRGARVVGSVEAVSGADQERLAVAFHRIIWPDGRTVSLQFNGLNQIGESALKDAVNRHYFSMFAAAGAVGILSGLTAIGSNPYAGGQQGFQAGASQGLGETAVRILDRFLNRLPTITIRAGHRLRIWFTGDVLVPQQPQPTGGIQ